MLDYFSQKNSVTVASSLKVRFAVCQAPLTFMFILAMLPYELKWRRMSLSLISSGMSLITISAFLLLLVALASLMLVLYCVPILSNSSIAASLSFEMGKSILIYIVLSAHLVSELTILMYSGMRFSISLLFSCLF